jgi:hypothetical protein
VQKPEKITLCVQKSEDYLLDLGLKMSDFGVEGKDDAVVLDDSPLIQAEA